MPARTEIYIFRMKLVHHITFYLLEVVWKLKVETTLSVVRIVSMKLPASSLLKFDLPESVTFVFP